MPEVLFSPQDLADRYQVPIGTIYRWNYLGKGPRPIRVGKHCRYRQRDIEAWEDEQAARDHRLPA
jgi:predicted DNA-binding transcriptional regulator AlpA